MAKTVFHTTVNWSQSCLYRKSLGRESVGFAKHKLEISA